MRITLLDRAIARLSPTAGLQRIRHRAAFEMATRALSSDPVDRPRKGLGLPSRSADEVNARNNPRLRAEMREMARTNPHIRKAISVWTTNLVGDGIMPRANSKDEKVNETVNALFAQADSQLSADGLGGLAAIQTLAVRGMVEGGDIFLRRRARRMSDGLHVPMQVQLFEAEQLDHSRFQRDTRGNPIINGVEFNRIGGRAAYWMLPDHPGYSPLRGNFGSVAVPADEIAHLFDRSRLQVTGTPWGVAALDPAQNLDEWEHAEGIRKKLEACMVGIVTPGSEGDDPVGGLDAQVDADGKPLPAGVVDAEGKLIETFFPGMIAYARGGKDIKFNQPAVTGGGDIYRRGSLMSVAAGFDLPYELLSGDLSHVSFISGRLGLQDFRRRVSALQWQVVIPLLCQPIWDWFCLFAHTLGKIPEPTVPVEWSPPSFEQINPLQEAMADLIAIRSGTKTLPEVIASRGRNPADVIAEIVKFNAMLDAAGIKLDSDPRHLDKTGALQSMAALLGGKETP
jgi:lambda family phage portal protein